MSGLVQGRLTALCAFGLAGCLTALFAFTSRERPIIAWVDFPFPAPTPLHVANQTYPPEPHLFIREALTEQTKRVPSAPSHDQAWPKPLSTEEASCSLVAWLEWPNGEAAAQLAVRLEPLRPGERRWIHGHTDGQGRLLVDSLLSGSYQLQVQVSPETKTSQSRRIELTRGRVEFTWTLPRGSVAIKGQLVDEQGLPVADHRVAARMTPGVVNVGEPTGIASTDEQGYFELPNLPPGEYAVESSFTPVSRHALGRDYPWPRGPIATVQAHEPTLDLGPLTRPRYPGYILEGQTRGAGKLSLIHPAGQTPLPVRVDSQGRFAWLSQSVPAQLELHWAPESTELPRSPPSAIQYSLLPAAGRRERIELP